VKRFKLKRFFWSEIGDWRANQAMGDAVRADLVAYSNFYRIRKPKKAANREIRKKIQRFRQEKRHKVPMNFHPLWRDSSRPISWVGIHRKHGKLTNNYQWGRWYI
jgi:hypothetical protein